MGIRGIFLFSWFFSLRCAYKSNYCLFNFIALQINVKKYISTKNIIKNSLTGILVNAIMLTYNALTPISVNTGIPIHFIIP